MKRESLSAPTQPLHHQSRSGMLYHAGGTYYHNGVMDYPRMPITERNLGKFLTLRNFKSGTSTPELKFVCEQPIFRSKCSGSKKLRLLNQLTNLLHRDRLQCSLILFDAMIASALKKLLNTQSNFRKRVSVEGQRAQKYDRFLRG